MNASVVVRTSLSSMISGSSETARSDPVLRGSGGLQGVGDRGRHTARAEIGREAVRGLIHGFEEVRQVVGGGSGRVDPPEVVVGHFSRIRLLRSS